jgi:hypothetical protein
LEGDEDERNGSIIDLHVTMIGRENVEEKQLDSFELRTFEEFKNDLKKQFNLEEDFLVKIVNEDGR